MSVYKVPQDVEAEDKLLGPFSFRQFIFLIVALAALAMAFGLAQVLLPLAIIPIPVALLFGALALPLKKDQPMEVYLAAVVSFILKPKQRLWQPDGIESLVEVIAPKVEEKTYGNGYDQEEVQRRLSYLANLVDSHGWSIRGVNDPDSSMQADLYNEAQSANDLMDDNSTTARNIDHLINKTDEQRRIDMAQRMQQASAPTATISTPQTTAVLTTINSSMATATPSSATSEVADSALEQAMAASIVANPYPAMHQATVTPLDERAAPTTQLNNSAAPAPNPSVSSVSPAIIDLANNHNDLSIETLQKEANRRVKEEAMEEEVVISLH